MIKGEIVGNKPLIPITIGWCFGVQDVLALVDTGFTGELKVSPKQAIFLGLQVTHTEIVTLADNIKQPFPASIAVVSLEGIMKVVNVLIAEGEPIVGVGLMKNYEYILKANFKLDILVLQKA